MHYREFVDFLIKYEDLNVKKQTNEEPFVATLISGGSDGTYNFK